MIHALHSSEEMAWQTPESVLDRVRKIDEIALDPCTVESNPTKARYKIWRVSEHFCGLSENWASYWGYRDNPGIVFVNPPYGPHLSGPIEPRYEHWKKDKESTTGRKLVGIGRGWAEKIAQAMEAKLQVLALVPTRTETDWWGRLFWASDVVCLGPRIPFVHPETGKVGTQPNHASTFFYAGHRRAEFKRYFAEMGILVIPASCGGT